MKILNIEKAVYNDFYFHLPLCRRTRAAPASLLAGQSLGPPPSYSMAASHRSQFTPPKSSAVPGQKTDPVASHPPHCPDLAPADFFLFPTLKRELVGLILSLDKFKTKWEGVIRTLTKDDFTKSFQRWLEQ